jgi:hypothetical protein
VSKGQVANLTTVKKTIRGVIKPKAAKDVLLPEKLKVWAETLKEGKRASRSSRCAWRTIRWWRIWNRPGALYLVRRINKFESKYFAPFEKLDQQDNQGEEQEKMNQAAKRISGDQSHRPDDDHDKENR